MIVHNLKIAFRNLWKYKIQNIIGILGVALGLVCFTLCCYIPRYITGWDKTYPDSDRMYGIIYSGENPSINLRNELQNKFPGEIEKTSFVFPSMSNNMIFEDESGKSSEYEIELVECDTSLLSFFSLKIISGNAREITHSINSVVLFESFAKKMGDSETLIGKSIFWEEKWFRITGIIKDLPKNSSLNIGESNGYIFNVIDGFFEKAKVDPAQYYVDILPSLVLLKKGIRINDFQEKLSAMAHLDGKGEKYQVLNFFYPLQEEGRKKQMTSIIIIGILILATGLLNYISFLMAQCYNRLDNYALRKVNGAGRIHLAGLIFTEFLLVWLLAGFLSLRIPDLFAPYFDLLKNQFIYFESHVVRRQLIEYILAGIPCIALICFILATSIERLSIKTILLGIINKGNRMVVRNVFLSIQMFIFVGFLSAVAIVYLQMNKSYTSILSTFTPEEKENTFIINCSGKKHLMENKEILLQTIKLSPLVQEVTYVYNKVSSKINIHTDVVENDALPYAVKYYISPEFPDFFNAKVLVGKFMDTESAPNMVAIDENFASLYKGENTIGKSFLTDDGESFTISCIVKNIQYFKELKNSRYINSKNPPVYYVSDVSPWNSYYIYVKPVHGKSKELNHYLNKCVREFLPSTIDFNIITSAEFIKESELDEEIVLLKTGSLFGTIAFAICLLSLYSSITLNTEYRRKEVAIRKINGAKVWDIIRLFAKTYLGLLAISCILVLPVVYYFGNQWLDQYTQRIFLTPIFFLCIILFVSAVMFATIVFKIKKVAAENPAEVVKGS